MSVAQGYIVDPRATRRILQGSAGVGAVTLAVMLARRPKLPLGPVSMTSGFASFTCAYLAIREFIVSPALTIVIPSRAQHYAPDFIPTASDMRTNKLLDTAVATSLFSFAVFSSARPMIMETGLKFRPFQASLTMTATLCVAQWVLNEVDIVYSKLTGNLLPRPPQAQ